MVNDKSSSYVRPGTIQNIKSRIHKSKHPNTINTIKNILSFAALSACFLSSSYGAALLSVDFGSSPAQSGFTAVSTSDPTTIGAFTIEAIGKFYTRGETSFDLYDDFFYENNTSSITVILSGTGIAANTDYSLKFWSFDALSEGTSTVPQEMSFTGISGSSGSAGPIVFDNDSNPTTLDEFSTTGTFTSDGTGSLTIEITDPVQDLRLNGLELSAVPEPSAAMLIGLAGFALVLRRRR